MPQSTKAQIQLGEVVVVMIIFFMILALGIVFYSQFAREDIRENVREIDRANLAEVAKILSSLPDIHCSFAGDVDLTCIDILRANVFAAQALGENSLHYSEVFQGYRARLQCVYPSDCLETSDDYNLFDYTPLEGLNSEEFVIPVTIYNPVTNENGYGLLIITQVT